MPEDWLERVERFKPGFAAPDLKSFTAQAGDWAHIAAAT
jgi:hypothetical protein